jgi:hypothetical protein
MSRPIGGGRVQRLAATLAAVGARLPLSRFTSIEPPRQLGGGTTVRSADQKIAEAHREHRIDLGGSSSSGASPADSPTS